MIGLFSRDSYSRSGSTGYVATRRYTGSSRSSDNSRLQSLPVDRTSVTIDSDTKMPGESIRMRYAKAGFWDHDQILLPSGDRLALASDGKMTFVGTCSDASGVFSLHNVEECNANTSLRWSPPTFEGYMYLYVLDRRVTIWDTEDFPVLSLSTNPETDLMEVSLEDSSLGRQAFRSLFGFELLELIQ